MLKHSKDQGKVKYYIVNLSDVDFAEQKPNEPMTIICDDAVFASACIKCKKPRCLNYFDDEYLCEEFPEFAAMTNDEVCPFRAIGWSSGDHEIVVDETRCIGCGICASRCPFGAIAIRNEVAVVNNNRPSIHYAVVQIPGEEETAQEECANQLDEAVTTRQIKEGTITELADLYEKLFDGKHTNEQALQFCRNLLIEAGCNCALRRIGDVYTRMDAVYSSQNGSGAVEIEFGTDTLSVARDILDDVAIMEERYSFPVSQNHPIAILASIPNARQGYLQVVDDIQKVIEIDIRTLTIGALAILMWAGAEVSFEGTKFRIAFRDSSIKRDIEELIGKQIASDDMNLGYYESAK